jgi:proteic killer suppression protein
MAALLYRNSGYCRFGDIFDKLVDSGHAKRYYSSMIKNFKCKETEKIWNQQFSKSFPESVQRTALRKLFMIHRAGALGDLAIPPANRLEKLKGDRSSQYSIRVNDQYGSASPGRIHMHTMLSLLTIIEWRF